MPRKYEPDPSHVLEYEPLLLRIRLDLLGGTNPDLEQKKQRLRTKLIPLISHITASLL